MQLLEPFSSPALSLKNRVVMAPMTRNRASGGFARDSAEQAIAQGRGELVAFARPWLANPDLVERLRRDLPLNPPDFSTFYTPGPKGYTDYPFAA